MPINTSPLAKKLKHSLHKNRLVYLAFAIPALILLASYMTRGIFPVGNRNVLTIDLFHQYAPFMAELQVKFTSGGSLFYSWAGGLGTNFWALYSYYLASPLNIILVLFPPSYLTEAIMLLTLIKIGLAGSFFYIFLRGVWKQQNLQMVALSVFYALSAYSLAYSWDIMWLDGIFILPLLMLGMTRLVRDKRYLLYCLSLGYILFSNYYIAYFIIIFTILYFPICLFQYNSFRKPLRLLASVGRFGAFSLLGGGLAAFLFVPTYFSLQLTSAANDKFPTAITHYFDLFDYIGQHFMLVSPTIRDGMPNMYAGILTMLLVPIYFFAKSISLKQKMMHLALILIMLLSFNINALNFIWHGFHFPNQLPYRNSFVYIFLILTIAYPALRSLKDFSGKQIGAVCASAVGLSILAQKLNDKPLELQTLYVTIIFIVVYAVVLTLDRIRKISKSDLALALLIVVVAEVLLNTLLTIHRIDSTEYYSDRNNYLAGVEVGQIREELALIKEAEGDNFYRVECIPPKTINDGFMYGYRGLSIFSSTMATKPVKTFENLGFHSNSINSYKYVNSTIVLDALFGIKYLIRRAGTIEDQVRDLYVKTSEIEISKNSYALSIGYLGLPELANWNSAAGNPFIAQNNLVTALTGSQPVFKTTGQENGELKNMTLTSSGVNKYSYSRTNADQESSAIINIVNPVDQQLYLYLDVSPNIPDRGYVMIGDKRIDFDAKRSTLVDAGFVSAGTLVEFNIFFKAKGAQTGSFELYSYGLDKTVFEQAITQLRDQSLTMTKFTDTQVEGTVEARADGVFMLSIPYDKGWKVLVDGVNVTATALDNGLMSFNLTAGTHSIKMSYTPEWFLIGLLISLLSLLVLMLIYLLPGLFKSSSKKTDVAEDIEQTAVQVVTEDTSQPTE